MFAPFEMGVRENGGSYSLGNEEPVVDINTYTYVRGYYERAMPLLIAGFGYCSKSFNARRAYGLYDVENERIERAYLSVGFVFAKRFPGLLHFPTFYKRKGDRLEPARWQVMEWDNETGYIFKTTELRAARKLPVFVCVLIVCRV